MANNDNAMARFLFAILQQKCLKDIDWNQVAHNPILTQEITNGHAARMRYSRFRAAMLGLEPQRRNRTNANKSRVSKKKKDEAPKPKKEEPEHSSGSGIGNIKMENIVDITTVKSERRSVSQALPQPTQPSAPMATPAMMKTEPGVVNAYQHIHHPSIFSVSSPRVKNERLPTATTTTKPPNPMPEPSTFNIPTTAASSAASPPYLDHHPRMPTMRLLTPCSDSDGSHVAQGFLPRNSPPPSDLPVHNQHAHHHPHQHHILVGAGSPPLSTAAPSPYEFSQCLDTTAAGTPSPWQSQQQHLHSQHHRQQHHIHNQNADLLYAAGFGLGLGNGTGTAGGAGFALDNVYNPFGSEHQHYHHPLQQFRMHHEEDGQHVADALGLQGATAGMFREREMDVGNDSGIGLGLDLAGQGVKCEWDADADGYHDV